MDDLNPLIDAYLQAYGDPDAGRRAQAVAHLWASDGRLIDPPLVAQGHAQIVAQADALLSQFPGHHFRRSSGIDAHHGMARYAWQLINASGAVALEGCDFAQVNSAGQLTQVTGFFGPLSAA